MQIYSRANSGLGKAEGDVICALQHRLVESRPQQAEVVQLVSTGSQI